MKINFYFILALLIFTLSLSAQHSKEELEAYWECMERLDLKEIRQLLEYHKYVQRIDARIYGLPKDDFDDQKALSIAERIFLRKIAKEEGIELPTSGPIQYPREIRHWLRNYYKEKGLMPDCSGFLKNPEEDPILKTLIEDGVELKLYEDTGVDNETNIAVNPYDQRYIVATSNDYSGSAGNDVYRSSDWGKTWVFDQVPASNSSCDPVSYYTRKIDGTPVVYHSYLQLRGFNADLYMKYSEDNGDNWVACAQVATSVDRNDHAIDTNPNSLCFNKIYVAYHSSTQYIKTSTGASFPYCNSWSTAYSTGVSGTIGSAIVVSLNPNGTNGVAHNFFTQYGTPGGVYHSQSTNCGNSWTTSKIYDINKPGTFEWGIPSTCDRQVYYYPQADSDNQPLSAYKNNIYIVWNDLSSNCTPPGCSGNTTCNNDIFFGKCEPNNRDNPSSWTCLAKINLTAPGGPLASDDRTDEFYPSISVDKADGSIYVSFYRTGSGNTSFADRQQKVHYYVARSINGGTTWENYRVTNEPSCEENSVCSGADPYMQWGDYTWNDVVNGVVYPIWTDRREKADEDIWSAKICSEPSHWTERAPSFTAPSTLCDPSVENGVQILWSAPDIYWGDGGENISLRKFQLYMDGNLVQDNINSGTTSIIYNPGDSFDHSYYIRAINSCNVYKNYIPVICRDLLIASEVSDDLIHHMKLNKNGSNINLTFEDVGAQRYNIYVSKYPETHDFRVNLNTDGKKDCNILINNDLGDMLEVLNYNPQQNISGDLLKLFILVSADNGLLTEGILGKDSTLINRTADSYCSK